MIERLKPRRIDIDDDDDEPTEAKTFVVKRGTIPPAPGKFADSIENPGMTVIKVEARFDAEAIRVTIEPIKSKRERRRDALRAWFSGSARERFSREDDMLDMLEAIDSEDPC